MKMNKSTGAWLVLLMSLFGTLNAQAAVHYVRQGATGSANGNDWSNAYTVLPNTLVRGDTYYIAAGSYSGRIFNTPASGSTAITIKKAVESDHGAATGWLSSYGTGQAAFNSGLEFTTSNWIFDGQTGGGAGNWNTGFGFKITEKSDASALIRIGYSARADNITIRHVEMQGKGSVSTSGGGYSNDAIAIYNASSNTTVSYAWLYGIGRCPVFMAGNQNTIFEHIYVQSHYASDAVHSEVMSSGQGFTGDTTWRYSLIAHTAGTGGLMWDNNTNPSSHLYVYGNIFYQPANDTWEASNGVIGGWTGNNGEEFRNAMIYNNTFINIKVDPLSGLPKIASGNVVYNNIFYNTASPNFAIFATHNYNHFINSGGTHSEANGTSATSGDPFENTTGLDFRLKAPTSVGNSLPSPFDRDPLSTIRGSDNTWDRGAFEFGGNNSGNTATLLPPTNLKMM